MFVRDFDENDLFSESVVKRVHVDEINGGAVVVIDFGDLEVPWVRKENTRGEKRLLVVDVSVHEGILDFEQDLGTDVRALFFHWPIFLIISIYHKLRQPLYTLYYFSVPLQSDRPNSLPSFNKFYFFVFI